MVGVWTDNLWSQRWCLYKHDHVSYDSSIEKVGNMYSVVSVMVVESNERNQLENFLPTVSELEILSRIMIFMLKKY